MKIFSNHKLQTSPKSPRTTRRAFTLVEMIVALGIFSVVAVVALGALVKIISANKKAQTLQASITNLNFALDAMSRDMSVGTNYYCDKNPLLYSYGKTLTTKVCDNGDAQSSAGSSVALAFLSSKTAADAGNTTCNLAYAYIFVPTVTGASTWFLQKATQSDCAVSISSSNQFFNILDPSVTITGYYVKVNYNANNPYPLATIRISGYAGVREKEKTYFDVQTSVSSRFKGGL